MKKMFKQFSGKNAKKAMRRMGMPNMPGGFGF
jgi:hypothetical protein